MASNPYYSLKDRLLQLGTQNNLFSNDIAITQPCVDATVTVGDESTNVRTITIQLKDANGVNIDYAEKVEVLVFLDSGATDFAATGGSTGIAIGASGKLLAVVAKKLFYAISTTAGVIALTWTDNGTEAAFIGVRLPNGRIVMGSQALTNT